MKILLVLAGIVIGLVLMRFGFNATWDQAVANAARPEVDLGPLTDRIAALEKQNLELTARLEATPIQSATTDVREPALQTPRSEAIPELTLRIARLETELADLRAKAETDRAIPAGPARIPSLGAASAALDQATQAARDLAATEAQRLSALRDLRGLKRADGTDARLAVLDDMILLAQTSTDAASRADIWRQLSHVTDSRLKQPLLDALAFDKDAKVREEAAETLADFLPDAVVEAALRSAMQNDASAGVKKQAIESLAGGH
ncbi:MAG: hypothetical protein ABI054_07335 [Planctomycetota bacterium]